MRTKSTAALAVIGTLAFTTAAQADRPGLALDRANRAAAHEADAVQRALGSESAHDWDEIADEPDTGPFIVGYDLEACDRVTATRAACDVTYTWTDGTECDDTVIVATTRHNRLRVRSDIDSACNTEA